jgi:hypothetical protein
MPVFVFDAVAGEVEERQVMAFSIPVEVTDRLSYNVMWLIVERHDFESGDPAITQDGRELPSVAGRRG